MIAIGENHMNVTTLGKVTVNLHKSTRSWCAQTAHSRGYHTVLIPTSTVSYFCHTSI